MASFLARAVLLTVVITACGLADFARPLPDDAAIVAPDGTRRIWSVWAEPDRFDIWISENGGPPRLLAAMPIEPALTTPSLAWEDAARVRYTLVSRGGNMTVTRIWRVGLDGQAVLIEHSERSP